MDIENIKNFGTYLDSFFIPSVGRVSVFKFKNKAYCIDHKNNMHDSSILGNYKIIRHDGVLVIQFE